MTEVAAGRNSNGLEMEPMNVDCARICSTWPVISFRASKYLGTMQLREALKEGVEARYDTKRATFFEADLGHTWVYFHIARKFRRIYLVAFIR
jgi:hypothetical protein